MSNLALLKDYVERADPELNIGLRNGNVSEKALQFDTFFDFGEVPKKLYRWMPNECIKINEDDIIADSAYLSCSSDIDSFLNHTNGNNIACLVIQMPQKAKHINVQSKLPGHNNEGEYILPRNYPLKKVGMRICTNSKEMDDFLYDENGVVSGKELLAIGIRTIQVYYLVPLE